uniref:HMA domain-containing protein n=1 Tax=Chaetoceros debilis TaxID=122233 RepID=A0A7S3Q154_9STRA|mmetsp:Transcript_29567/g.45136  ORF Transcript_29567/g.45136 Transcript_29567/m.45136 type:complete len:1152 (+) Transcript_29567:83-3538(+)
MLFENTTDDDAGERLPKKSNVTSLSATNPHQMSLNEPPTQNTVTANTHADPEPLGTAAVAKNEPFNLSAGTNSVGAAYHPEFMFCGACSTCAEPGSSTEGAAGMQPNALMMMNLPKFPKKIKRHRPNKHAMVFVSNATDSDDEKDIAGIDMKGVSNGTYVASVLPDDGNKNHRSASIYISNLSKESSQNMLLTSVLESTNGIASVKTYGDHPDEMKAKSVDIVYDPINVELDAVVKSLNDLGLNATLTKQSSDTVTSSMGHVKKSVRSSLHVEGICCASEVPQVTNILRTASSGVEKVRINITSRMVYVDHDPDIILVADLLNELNREGFGATVKKDGGAMRKRSTPKRLDNHHGRSDPESQAEQFARLPQNITFVESTLTSPCLAELEDIDSMYDVLDQAGLIGDQIRYAESNIASRTIKVEHNPNLITAQNVANALMDEGGYSNVTVLTDGKSENLILPSSMGPIGSQRFRVDRRCRLLRFHLPKGLGLNIILSGIFWIISLFGHFVEKWSYLQYAGLLSVLFGIPSVAKKAYRTIRRKHFDANCMMVTAAFGALALQQYDEAASVSFLFSISEYLEDRATRRARKALDTIINLRPDHANLINPRTNEIIIVPACELEVGSLVSVRTGDKIPSDGIVVEGFSQVDESSLTGESVPINKEAGDVVSGGTINAGNTRLVIRMTSIVEDSAVSRLIRLVEESASNRSPTELVVDAFAKSYTPIVICAAILMCTIPWFYGLDVGRRWTLNGLIIVVIACPCALTISTPVTYAAGLAATAQMGIIVKGGARLEALGSVKTIVFDKTGTLTEGKFRLVHLDIVGDQKKRRDVLELLALVEAPSSHPLAATLVNAAKNEGINMSSASSVVNHSILKGEGVTAEVDGDRVYVGNTRLFKRIGFYEALDSAQKKKVTQWNEEGGTVGFVGIKNIGIVGMFSVADGIRKEAKSVISSLLNDDINVLMLTGDGDGAAKAVARDVGIPFENVRSQFLPEDKLHYVSSMLGFSKRKGGLLTKKELLLFCGDGVNDAPALAVADIGVAMGEGAALAMEMSDVTLMDSNLTKLLYSIKIGAKVIVTVQENIVVSVVIKLIVIALTFAGKMSLLGAIASDVGVMLLVSLNGMKLLPGRRGLCCKRRNAYRQLTSQHPQASAGEIV